MKKIYSKNGEINIDTNDNYYYFDNIKTAMFLKLHKRDIDEFMNNGMEQRFIKGKSYSNFISSDEEEAIKSYLRIKDKRLSDIKSLINNGEKLEDIINIMPLKSLIEYVGDDKWKKL